MSSGYADDLVAESRRGYGAGSLVSPRATARRANPACGDEVELDLGHDGVLVSAVAHRSRGCAFTVGSASLLARRIPGMTMAHARALASTVRRDLAGSGELPAELGALSAVRLYPARIRCALLPWEALASALDKE